MPGRIDRAKCCRNLRRHGPVAHVKFVYTVFAAISTSPKRMIYGQHVPFTNGAWRGCTFHSEYPRPLLPYPGYSRRAECLPGVRNLLNVYEKRLAGRVIRQALCFSDFVSHTSACLPVRRFGGSVCWRRRGRSGHLERCRQNKIPRIDSKRVLGHLVFEHGALLRCNFKSRCLSHRILPHHLLFEIDDLYVRHWHFVRFCRQPLPSRKRCCSDRTTGRQPHCSSSHRIS